MDGSAGAQIFWMITLGLVIGFVGYYVFAKRGVELIPSILVAVSGSLVTGIASLILNLSMGLAYSVIGAMGFLFVVNVFRQKERQVFVDTDRTSAEGEES